MSNHRFHSVRLVLALSFGAVAALLTGCQRTVAVEGPHIRPIDRACLPVGRSPDGEIPLYRGEIATIHAKIATIDSYAADCKDEATVRAQLNDIQCKARLTGADAVISVRPLSHQLYGFVNDPNTPFPAVRQDGSQQYFFRGTAIKYQEPVVGEPARIEVKEPPLPAGALRPGQQNRGDRLVPVPFSGPLGPGPNLSGNGGATPQTPVPAPNPLDAAAQPIR